MIIVIMRIFTSVYHFMCGILRPKFFVIEFLELLMRFVDSVEDYLVVWDLYRTGLHNKKTERSDRNCFYIPKPFWYE
jgi:hypothetical protein